MRSCRMLQITGLLGLFPGSKIFFFHFKTVVWLPFPFLKQESTTNYFVSKIQMRNFRDFFFFFFYRAPFYHLVQM